MINNFHIHLYYDETNIEIAKDLAKEAKKIYPIDVGTFHEKNVGPHPRWSVQLAVPVDIFGDVLTFVALNRKGLTVFSHPTTGNGLKDHVDHAIWMGEVLDLNAGAFTK